MSHVFISYKQEDMARARRIAGALENSGFSVWWDRSLPNAQSWHVTIEEKLKDAGCVIVLWSHGAVAPEGHFVRDEARVGQEKGLLVPVLIDRVRPPLGFGELQAIDLVGWRGNASSPFYKDLVATVRAKIEGGTAPPPRGQKIRLARRVLAGGAASLALSLVAAMAFDAFGAGSKVCAAPGLQPGLSDACGAAGVGGRPTRDERLAWSHIAKGSCQALRDHINRFPNGAYHGLAGDLLAARTVTQEDRWSPAVRRLTLVATEDGAPAATLPAAQANALKASQTKAANLCRALAAGTIFRFRAAKPVAETWTCTGSTTKTCTFEGHADCEVDVRDVASHETCGASAP